VIFVELEIVLYFVVVVKNTFSFNYSYVFSSFASTFTYLNKKLK